MCCSSIGRHFCAWHGCSAGPATNSKLPNVELRNHRQWSRSWRVCNELHALSLRRLYRDLGDSRDLFDYSGPQIFANTQGDGEEAVSRQLGSENFRAARLLLTGHLPLTTFSLFRHLWTISRASDRKKLDSPKIGLAEANLTAYPSDV